MSVPNAVVDSKKGKTPRSKPRVNMQAPPSGHTVSSPGTAVLPSNIQSQHIPYESREHSVEQLQAKQANATSQTIAPVAELKTQHLLPSSSLRQHPTNPSEQSLTYAGSSSIETQRQPVPSLEKQLRNMILSHEPPSGHQRKSSSDTSGPTPLPPHLQNPQPNGNRRRPNQAQRKQQAQQMQLPLQYPPVTPNMTNPHPVMHYGPNPMRNQFDGHRQPTINLPQHNTYQRWAPGAVVQQRTLFDPNLVANSKATSRQKSDLQSQVSYVDQLARLKIPEVQMSAEECAEKQKLKELLNDICRRVICEHELQSNPDFPIRSVELKSFGSLSIGFATKDSDMDLVIVSPESKPSLSAPESEIPAKIEQALMELGYGARLLTKTRVPIIKFCEKPSSELAAHLRLTRLWWEKERDLSLPQAYLDSPGNDSEVAEESHLSTGNLQEQNSNQTEKIKADSQSSAGKQNQELDLDEPGSHSSPLSEVEKSSSFKDSNTPRPSAATEKDKKVRRESLKFDSAWITRLSDNESIGLLQILMKAGRCPPQQRSFVLGCLDGQLDPGESASSRELLNTMPEALSKIQPPSREDLDFPKSGVGTQCDINFSNQLALHNSLLLKCYSLCDPRVRQMVLFVKAWTKIRKINSPYHGTLNSYGYVLMVLHFLMNVVQPPVLPNLQLATDMIERDPVSSQETTLGGYNIRFFRNEAAIEEMARNGEFSHNRESLGSLLRSFFQFYANPPFGAFSWKDDVLSLRTRGGILKKVGKGWTGAKVELVDMAGPGIEQKKVNHRYVVAIEDPFETEHNVARTVVFNGVVAIRDEFRRAADLISHVGVDPRLGPQDFFAEGKKKEHLQRRNDGPHKNPAPKKNVSSSSVTAKESKLSKENVPNANEIAKKVLPVPT